MSSFQNFFDDDFLLSSSLKPKNINLLPENVLNSADLPRCNKNEFSTLKELDKSLKVEEPQIKRVCVMPEANIIENQLSNNVKIDPNMLASHGSLVSPVQSPSLSDQILQVRIKLQIYQKEYAHFVECANRSSLQIQETLEELQKLVNLNFNFESSKTKIVSNDVSTVSDNNSAEDSFAKKSVPSVAPSQITINSIKHRPRAFPRKPRCLSFNSSNSSFSDMMLTSSLDGSVQIWSKAEQKIQSSVYLPSVLHKPFFVGDLCWDRQPNGLLALGVCESANAPAFEDSNGFSSNRSDRQIAFLQFNPNNPISAPIFISSNIAPHERSISVIESWSSAKHNSEISYFLTGGLDRTIYSWKVCRMENSIDFDVSANELHRRHTSSVQAICYDWESSDIWSGGADCRIIQWSGEENRLVNEMRWENRISHLIKSKIHPNLILATVASMSSQLRLFDSRIKNIIHSFGIQETANLSRYVRPSWHPDGNLIANGTLSPADSVGSINIWDIRMMGSSKDSTNLKHLKSINCEDRRLIRTEFAPDGKSLVGMSTDGSTTFIDFTCS